MGIAERSTIALDSLLLGLDLSATPYSVEDKKQIIETLTILVKQQFSQVKPTTSKHYTASAGAPGAGKTFALEKMQNIDVAHGKFPKYAIYIGPDSVALPQIQAYLKNCADPQFGPLKAYEKWRAASNYIANFMMVKAIADGLNIVHDTTATNPRIKTILEVLGQEGYAKHLHFFIADKVARDNALLHRKKKLGYVVDLKASPTISKAEAAFERIADGTYLNCVDTIVFYLQKGDFYLGKGETIAFAKYNPKESGNVQILADKKPFVTHILKQMDE